MKRTNTPLKSDQHRNSHQADRATGPIITGPDSSSTSWVYFLPRTNLTAAKKEFLLFERASETNSSCQSEIGSLKRATLLIQQIKATAPHTTVILDTATESGRELLKRSIPLVRFGTNGYDTTFQLCQLFDRVKGQIPAARHGYDPILSDQVLSYLFSARSQGGCRPCQKEDTLIAEIGRLSPNRSVPARLGKALFSHPLCLVPRFFVEETKRCRGTETHYRATEIERQILQIGTGLARLRQSLFPIEDSSWSFGSLLIDVTDPEMPISLKSHLDDFLFAVLSGSTRARGRADSSFPVQSAIVRAADRFLAALEIETTLLFHEKIQPNRYERIRGLLDLLLGVWTFSCYADCVDRPQIIDSSILEATVRENFNSFFNQQLTSQ